MIPRDYYHEETITEAERRKIKCDAFWQKIDPYVGPFFAAMSFLIAGVIIGRLVF